MSEDVAWAIWGLVTAFLVIFGPMIAIGNEDSNTGVRMKWWFGITMVWVGPIVIQAYLRVLAS